VRLAARCGGAPMTKSKGIIKYQPRGAKAAFVEQAVAYTGNDCLIWPYHRNWAGYGVIEFRGQRNYRVHRIVCERTQGQAPEDKSVAAHLCGNPACVAPTHLRWASQAENLADRVNHGTMIRGTKARHAKLTDEDIPRIRTLAKLGMTSPKIAEQYGVIPRTIRNILNRETWAWL
jgi:hypothetical protein